MVPQFTQSSPFCRGQTNHLKTAFLVYGLRIRLGLGDPGWGETEFSGRSLGVCLCYMRTCKDDVKLDSVGQQVPRSVCIVLGDLWS